MKVILERKYIRADYTIGTLYIISGSGDIILEVDTLEDTDRGLVKTDSEYWIKEHKILGKTAIPVGKYEIKLTYSERFKRKLPILLNVTGFEGIRIHAGNTQKDTSGCILVGQNKIKGGLINSEKCLLKILSVLNWELQVRRLWIEIIYSNKLK